MENAELDPAALKEMSRPLSFPLDERGQKAGAIKTITLGFLGASVLGIVSTAILWIFNGGYPVIPITAISLLGIVTSLLTLWLVRAGKVTFAGYFSVVLSLAEAAVITAMLGDFLGPFAVIYLIPIFVAGIEIGINSSFLVATLAAVFYLVMIPVEQAGLLPRLVAPVAKEGIIPLMTAGIMIIFFYLVAFLSWFAASRLGRVLGDVRRYATELQTANGKIQASEEELRSSNEKLEAANEDLRAAEVELRSNKLLHEANEEMRKATRATPEFMAKMSHELRTPLNVIIGFSELMLDGITGKINTAQKESLNDILTSGRLLLDLINDILDLSRIESGRLELKLRNFSLQTVIESLRQVMMPVLAPRKQTLEIYLAAELPMVHADRDKVRQVLYNLLSNATRFTHKGGELKIEALKDDEWCRVSVTGNGVGIRQEDQTRLFQPFCQIENPLTDEGGGTGLGLTIARQIIERHGGRIWVDSDYGRGSRFNFTLPLAADGSPVKKEA